MTVDVLGRIRNTSVPPGHAFIPLFEAVINSIHATEDRFGAAVSSKGSIEIRIERQPLLDIEVAPGRPPVGEIMRIVVTDNGGGFADENLLAFATADTMVKAERGGKGLGRFSWLVVFERADVESVVEEGRDLRRRTFSFQSTPAGIEDFVDEPAPVGSKIRTSVALTTVRKRYAGGMRKGAEAIADRLFEHCFDYFVLGRCPSIVLLDDDAADSATIRVNDRMQEVECDKPTDLAVGEHELQVIHVQRKHASAKKHTAHLCANRRVVESFSLAECTELGDDPFHNAAGESVVHHAFVSGRVLDRSVDPTRTRLDLPRGAPLLEGTGELDLKTLRERLAEQVNHRLADVLKAERDNNFRRLDKVIRSEMPEYRHLLKRRPQQVARVRFTSDRQKLDERLYRLGQASEAESRRRMADILKKAGKGDGEPDEIARDVETIVAEVSEQSQSSLVRYVAKRRIVLLLLRQLISIREGPALEAHVHNVVFPMGKTADDIEYDEHNLWLVDDTLSFYEHIASDIALAKQEAAPSDSRERPDILAFSTSDPYQHVALVELKKPDRKDENPVQQLVGYADRLRKGGKKDRKGVTMLPVPPSVRIDGFAVCTLTPKLNDLIRVGPADMTFEETEGRWFGYQRNLNLWIEVLDFRTFIRRAEQRNRAFFVKLGLT